jgi:hypothetical protein
MPKTMAKNKKLVFENDNGRDYFIVAGNDDRALLRDIDRGSYVIATNLDWTYMCWGGGEYFSPDEFGKAVKVFLGGGTR